MPLRWRFVLTVALVAAAAGAAEAQTKLLRFPDIHGDRVVFSYAGDLWAAPTAGGTATRLTAHPGLEMFARFSPDGRWIAFTGQYDGDEQVYVMPATGGEPRQLTFYPARYMPAPRHGFDNLVYGWTPDGTAILFRSMRDADGIRSEGRLYTVPVAGGLGTALPMPTSGAGEFAPDGKRVVYSPLFRDFRTWKRYQGGWAQDLYVYDLASGGVERIVPSARTERDPMWLADGVYFVSDRDGTLNLYRRGSDGAAEQLTRFDQWDVRWASSDNDRQIVYELGGELRVFDAKSGEDRAVPITVPSDLTTARPARVSAEKQIEDYALSPGGERALFVARGDVFTAPIEHGATRNLTASSGAHDRWARWSPDGKSIAYISDASGEDQVWVVDQDGFGAPRQLTSGLAAMLYAPEWADDGARIAFADKDGKLYVLTVASGKLQQIADDRLQQIRDYAWAPGGGQLAFSMNDRNGNRSIHIWDAADGTVHRVHDELFNEYAPAWDPEGKYLYYLSDREFTPQISAIEWNYAGNRMTGVFAVALRPDLPSPVSPESDEVKAAGEGTTDDATEANGEKDEKTDAKTEGVKAKDAKKVKAPIRIDYDGLAGRVARVPIEAENIDGLAVTPKAILFTLSGAPFYGRESGEKTRLRIYDLEERELSDLVGEVDGYALSADGTKALVREGRSFQLWDVKPKAKDPKKVATKGLMVDRVPAEEFREIFDEVWRRYRDFFYVENMHGYDWAAIREQYRPWLDHVAHRSDLNYLLGEMVAELNIGHAYIQGGDYELPERPKVGLPGARFALDEGAGRYRISAILRGHNEEERYRSPLTAPGVDVKVGDYVLAIDGVELTARDNPYRLLRHKTDPVTLTVNAKPALEGARRVTYEPIDSEDALLYLEFVEAARARVDRLTGGRAGYLHIPDMGAPGAYEFVKWYYPQIRKEGLVVDVRSNGGGNISQWIIERLDSRLLGTRFGRISQEPATYPYTVFHGHKVCLINETSASDGDIFPYRFRDAGLGPLVGKRTWGGVVGISGRGPLIDGGQVFVPEQGTNDPEGRWVIEGHGVDPDVEVEQDPAAVLAGGDPQLERGVAILLEKMAKEPMRLPQRPPDPVKTRAPVDAPTAPGTTKPGR